MVTQIVILPHQNYYPDTISRSHLDVQTFPQPSLGNLDICVCTLSLERGWCFTSQTRTDNCHLYASYKYLRCTHKCSEKNKLTRHKDRKVRRSVLTLVRMVSMVMYYE